MSLTNEIERCGREMNDPHNDGFTSFYYKQKILQVMWECQKWLENSPNIVGEDEWIAENKPSTLT